jgi:hypothetical protein
MRPLLRPSITAAVSTSWPRLVLISMTPSRILAIERALTMWRVFGVRGMCNDTMWLRANSSSSST